MKDIFFEVDVQCPKKLHEIHNDLPFLTERMKLEKVKKLVLIYMIKLNIYIDIHSET